MKDMCLGKTSSFTDSLDLRIVDESGHKLDDLNVDMPEDYENLMLIQNE